MSTEQFTAIMPYICNDLIKMIIEKQSISGEEAIAKLYGSALYAMLEDEETKVWQYSTPMLYALLEQETVTGELRFPDV